MIPFGQDPVVKIDVAHANLLTALVQANKPKTLLEIGIGGGQGTDAILAGLDFNQQSFDFTIVDNWNDWGGQRPSGVTEKYGDRCTIVDSAEKDFVFSTDKKFDFILSDGDHMQADQWFEHVLSELVLPEGILIYHDINLFDADAFQNLNQIYYRCQDYGLRYHLFNRNSRADERCQRGLLVIFKG